MLRFHLLLFTNCYANCLYRAYLQMRLNFDLNEE